VLLRQWRQRRRLSQLDLALSANVSTRHLSHVETGKASPSSAMIERLAEQLEVPLRDRNRLLLSGGYAPVYPEHALSAPPMAAVSAAIRQVLTAHLPFPALVIDGHWDMVDANEAVPPLLAGVSSDLLEPPVNVLRLSLHPLGLAPRIVNLGQWRAHLLDRIGRQIEATGDPELVDLRRELASYPGGAPAPGSTVPNSIIVPMRYRTDTGDLNFFSTTTVFGTPRDITVAELAIESFYPADAETAAALGS
jgi:transcriptional regulator with XRE-family HTH domain